MVAVINVKIAAGRVDVVDMECIFHDEPVALVPFVRGLEPITKIPFDLHRCSDSGCYARYERYVGWWGPDGVWIEILVCPRCHAGRGKGVFMYRDGGVDRCPHPECGFERPASPVAKFVKSS
jgi:hypothetical protein